MAVELYEHNLEAYNAAREMLDKTGKAFIVHPTGTGKSFIGFKLAEDNPDKRVLWLTPSEYIVKTQLENLRKEGGSELKNITFITYSKLMHMSDEEMSELKPDIGIIDEGHRLGATQWGAGFERLCRLFPDMLLLGLSATHIRYLDNQRDMAEELFDGNIASHMTLGEAIVRGILAPPKYVLSVFAYRKELEKYKKRVDKARSKAVRDAGEKYLEALRRALERADGLDKVFEKHMPDRSGKYIVFCANAEHMAQMAEMVPEWFAGVDRKPNVYTAYSGDPETSKEFRAFKEDNSEHLKLLFCIDMLNEGIHVDDISGVILLRPTVSPIIYKQQIGRALAAGKKKDTVIFDIVQNFENLYSISDIKEEMNEIIRYYQSTGEEYEIVNESFSVIDEVRDCRRLFNELERTLSASWECMYAAAKEYYAEHGDLLPLQGYTNNDGYHLGQWIVSQRIAYMNGTLSKSRILRLEQIGMDWHTAKERLWDASYMKAKAVYDKYGSLDSAPRDIAQWLNKQRVQYRKGTLTKDRFDRLSDIGMVWELEDRWLERYNEARAYFEKHGDLDIPAGYVSGSGANLGRWYRDVRGYYINGTLSEERKRMLDEIGFNMTSVKIRTWMNYYELAKSYYNEHGDLKINAKYETEDGTKLGVWISGQRYMYSKNKLTAEQIRRLEGLGIVWDMSAAKWEIGYRHLCEYKRRYGNALPENDHVTGDGFMLGAWAANQRSRRKSGGLSESRIKRLDSIGFVWEPNRLKWQKSYSEAKQYFDHNGSMSVSKTYVTDGGVRLRFWIDSQKKAYKSGKLNTEQVGQLREIGIV